MRHVLMLAAIYPPMNRVAARRPAGLAKYLPDHGWVPHVITRDWSASKSFDPSYRDDAVEGAVRHRVVGGRDDIGHATWMTHVRSWRQGYRYPVEWTRGAEEAASRVFAEHPVNAIFATYPSASTLHVARSLAARHGIPWVADFRDLAGEVRPTSPVQWATTMRHIFWEKRLARSASRLTTAVWGSLLDRLRARHGIETLPLPNGFDPDVFYPAEGRSHDLFRMVFTGALNPGFHLDLLGLALDEMMGDRVVDPADIEIIFLGTGEERVRASLGSERVWPTVRVVAWSSAAVVARAQREATVLVHASNPDSNGWMTGKIMEYIAAHRPILTVPGDAGGVDQLLESTGAGVVGRSVPLIKEQLLQWYGEWQRTGEVRFSGKRDEIEKYAYPNLAGRLAGLLDQVIVR